MIFQKKIKKRIDFTRGSGETLAFLPSLMGMFLILMYLIAFVQFDASIDAVVTSLETVGRSVSVCSSFDDASDQAQRVAESCISRDEVSDILTEISYIDEDVWKAGTCISVTLKAHIDTIEPFLLSRTVSKKMLVTVEYDDRQSDVTLSGDGNAEKIFNYMVSKGFSKQAAAAVVGSCYQESGCNPESEGMGGCGIAGFTPASRLKTAAAQQGRDWRSLEFQLKFLVGEIEDNWYGEESTQTAAFISAGLVEAGISFSDFQKMKDVKKAADVFCAYYEQCWPHNAMLEVREEAAEAAYNQFK